MKGGVTQCQHVITALGELENNEVFDLFLWVL